MSSFGRERSTSRGGKALDPCHRRNALDVRRDFSQEGKPFACEEIAAPSGRWFSADGDDQRLRAAKLTAEALVIAIQRIVLGEPGADVVVDVRDIRTGKKKRRAQNERPTEWNAPPIEARGEPVHAD